MIIFRLQEINFLKCILDARKKTPEVETKSLRAGAKKSEYQTATKDVWKNGSDETTSGHF